MIEIGKYKIEKMDGMNWQVAEKRIVGNGKKAGMEVLTARKYFPRLDQAAVYLLDQAVGNSNATSLQNLITTVNAARVEIVKAVNKANA